MWINEIILIILDNCKVLKHKIESVASLQNELMEKIAGIFHVLNTLSLIHETWQTLDLQFMYCEFNRSE